MQRQSDNMQEDLRNVGVDNWRGKVGTDMTVDRVQLEWKLEWIWLETDSKTTGKWIFEQTWLETVQMRVNFGTDMTGDRQYM